MWAGVGVGARLRRQLCIFDEISTFWAARKASRRLSVQESLLAGAAAGGAARLLTTPLDVARSRLMLAPGARKEIDRAMAEAGDRLWAELQKPGKTLAVVDMAWLLPKDGLLDRLKAHGATVGPPPMIAAVERAEADDGKD